MSADQTPYCVLLRAFEMTPQRRKRSRAFVWQDEALRFAAPEFLRSGAHSRAGKREVTSFCPVAVHQVESESGERLAAASLVEMLAHPALTGDASAVRCHERVGRVLDDRSAPGTDDPAVTPRIVQAGDDLDGVGAGRFDRHAGLTSRIGLPLQSLCSDGY